VLGFVMIVWIFPVASCAGVLLMGFVYGRADQRRPTPQPALVPVRRPR
jgi:hypothetical protein